MTVRVVCVCVCEREREREKEKREIERPFRKRGKRGVLKKLHLQSYPKANKKTEKHINCKKKLSAA